jgi:peroxiredoxin
MAIAVGAEAPEFTLKDQHGNEVSLSKFRGQPVALVFYPFTFTGVCEGELCEIRDEPSTFEAANVQVLAISCDSQFAQKQWSDTQGYTFPVLSDFWPHGEVAKAYGVFNDALGCANRGSFLINADGTVAAVIESANLGTARSRADYEAALATLA